MQYSYIRGIHIFQQPVKTLGARRVTSTTPRIHCYGQMYKMSSPVRPGARHLCTPG